jgi:hypothetical protein
MTPRQQRDEMLSEQRIVTSTAKAGNAAGP